MQYYIKKCQDPEFRYTHYERNKELYRGRTSEDVRGEVVYMMVRPGRPRKYGIETPPQNNTMSTPSTIAHYSTNGSDDES